MPAGASGAASRAHGKSETAEEYLTSFMNRSDGCKFFSCLQEMQRKQANMCSWRSPNITDIFSDKDMMFVQGNGKNKRELQSAARVKQKEIQHQMRLGMAPPPKLHDDNEKIWVQTMFSQHTCSNFTVPLLPSTVAGTVYGELVPSEDDQDAAQDPVAAVPDQDSANQEAMAPVQDVEGVSFHASEFSVFTTLGPSGQRGGLTPRRKGTATKMIRTESDLSL